MSNGPTIESCRNLARDRLLKQQLYYQSRLQSTTRRNPFKPGDLCYIKNSAPSIGTTKKLVNKFFGPYLVIGVRNGSALLLNPENKERFTANLELTKPHTGDLPEHLTELRNEIINNENETSSNDENLTLENSEATTSTNQSTIQQQSRDEDCNPLENQVNYDNINDNDADLSLNVNLNSNSSASLSDSEAETIAEDQWIFDFDKVNQLNSKKKKRKKYQTANREIMKNIVITDNNSDQVGPTTRARKIHSVNLIIIKHLKVKSFEISAKNTLAFLSARISNSQLQLQRARVNFTPSSSLFPPLSLCDLLCQLDFLLIDVNQNFSNFFSSFNHFLISVNSELQFSEVSCLIQLCFKKLVNLIELIVNLIQFESFPLSLPDLLISSSSFLKLNLLCLLDFNSNLLDLLVDFLNFGELFCELTCEHFGYCDSYGNLVPYNMSDHAYSEDSNDSMSSFHSIVSSTTFAEALQQRLDEIDENPRSPDPELPVVELELEPPLIPKFDETEVKTEPDESDVPKTPTNSVNDSTDYVNNQKPVKEVELKQVQFDWGEPPKSDLKFPDSVKIVNKNFWEKNQREKFNRMDIPNPLPHPTEFGLRSGERHRIDREVDTSPYPPPDVNQGRFNCEFPAPAPPPESNFPTHMQYEFLEKAKESIVFTIEGTEKDKSWFELFIKEKLQFNVLDTDLSNVKFSSLRKGLPASHVINSDLARLKNLITCTLCEQIPVNPKCCEKCSKPYCFGCVRWLQSLPQDLNLEKVDALDTFMCINQTCLVSVEKNGYPKYTEIADLEVKKFFEEATYKCHRVFCTRQLIYVNLLNHLQSCRLGPVDFKFDKTLQLQNFVAGPVREELNAKPTRLTSLLPVHLKKQIPTLTHEQDWAQRAMVWGFLIKCYKNGEITPLAMRAQANFGNHSWNLKQRLRDPTTPLDEGEKFILKIGFPSISEVPIPDVPKRWPTTQCSRVPHYLLRDSPNWRRWFNYQDIDDASSISSTSSMVLYALDIEDPQSPFIRVNPFERLSPAEAEEAQDLLTESFPSCFNYQGNYKEPIKSNKPETIAAVERKRRRLAQSFANRPKVNLPPLLDEHVNVLAELSSTCDDKHLTFAINMFCCGINEWGKVKPRPVWVIIVDANLEVVYETFVRYREIDHLDQRFHGLTPADIKYARNLNTVRDQVTKFLVCAKRVIGYGLINHLVNLGLTRHEIKILNPKFRDVNNYYSPYIEHPMNLHAIAFLWFSGYVLPPYAHSPAVEAITAMRLYLLQWTEIEIKAAENSGIHNENASSTCGNRITAGLLHDFCEGIKAKVCRWPIEWNKNPRAIKIPEFNDNCVLPSNLIMKKPNEMSRPNFRKILRGKESFKTSGQVKRANSGASSSSSSPKNLKPMEPRKFKDSSSSAPEIDSEDPNPNSSKPN